MPLTPTLALLVAMLALTVFAGWRGARPPDLMRGPRMAPWRFLMVLGAAVSLALLVHLAALLGLRQPG